jgi:hypothetical protein
MENNLDHIIDKKIQAAMGDFEVPYQPSHWDKMQDKMNQMEAQETQFDDSLRNRLSNLEKKFEPTHWAAMASQLDNLDTGDTDFDDTIRERVERVEAPYSPSHWEIMNKQLDEHFTLKGKIVRYKIIEVSLMLLALFTAFNMIDTEESSKEPVEIHQFKTEQNTQPSKVTEPKSFNKGYDWRKQNNNQNSKKQNPNQPIVSLQNVDNQYVINEAPENNLNINAQSDLNQNQLKGVQNDKNGINSVDKTNLSYGVEGVNPIVATTENKTAGSENTVTTQNTEGPTSPSLMQDAVVALSIKSISELNVISETPMAPLDLNVSSLNKANSSDVAEAINVLRPKALSISSLYQTIDMPTAKKNQWWRFGLFGTSSSDIAQTDYSVNNLLKEGTNIAEGNKGLGFSVGFKKGKFELESGLAFKHKEYTPNSVNVITGSFLDNGGWDTIVTPNLVKMNVLNIPLNFNYYFSESKRFNFYASIGATANFAMGINAIYPAEVKIDQKAKKAQANNNLQSNNTNGDVKQIDIALYSNGIIDDFKLKENYYFTAQAALGLEYKMSPFTSLFLQTGYEQHILRTGIGSFNDRISSFNLQAGAKVSFGKTKF